jgi:esterase FrsA
MTQPMPPQPIPQRPIADSFAEYAANPDAYLSIQGVPPEIAARLPGFADFGIDGDQLVGAVREAGPQMGPATPGWANAIMRHGDAAMALGEGAETRGDGAAAERAFLHASFWYFFARFPHILGPDGAEAYRRHIGAYLRAAQHFASGFKVLKIPFEGATVTAYLRLPPGTSETGWPVVVLWGGIDVWKSDLELHSQSEALLKQGIATLTVDMPGTGECPIPVSSDAERALSAAIDAVQRHELIDETRVGCYGLSFGGHWAVKLSLLRPELSGVVNNAGPVHHAFQPEWVGMLPIGTRLALSKVMGLEPQSEAQALLARLSALSLIGQGWLPTERHAPLLSLNGERDELVPVTDLEVIGQNGVRQDRLVFAHDRHVASRHWALHEPFVAHWFARRLRVR